MTDDLVKWLRYTEFRFEPPLAALDLMDQAAYCIEQLTDDLKKANDRIEQLEDAIFRYVSTVVRHEGVTFIDEETEDWQRLIFSVFDARAALEGKDGKTV